MDCRSSRDRRARRGTPHERGGARPGGAERLGGHRQSHLQQSLLHLSRHDRPGCRGTGPRIGPTALPFDAFVHEVRQPVNQMVPFPPTILSDQDLADIYAYLQSQKKEDYKQIPLLSQSE